MTLIWNLVIWATFGAVCAFVGAVLPEKWFDHDSLLAPPTAKWEQGGGIYSRVFRIHYWKDFMPDLGSMISIVMPKQKLDTEVRHQEDADEKAYLRRFVIETRRAEAVHWIILVSGFFYRIWNDSLLISGFMSLLTIVTNLPFIMIQRFNRPRLIRLLKLTGRRKTKKREEPTAVET